MQGTGAVGYTPGTARVFPRGGGTRSGPCRRYELVKLEKYKAKKDLLDAIGTAEAVIVRSDVIDPEATACWSSGRAQVPGPRGGGLSPRAVHKYSYTC